MVSDSRAHQPPRSAGGLKRETGVHPTRPAPANLGTEHCYSFDAWMVVRFLGNQHQDARAPLAFSFPIPSTIAPAPRELALIESVDAAYAGMLALERRVTISIRCEISKKFFVPFWQPRIAKRARTIFLPTP